ncbi:diaminobutyrate acetyltransferase [Thiomicrospira cyclica]|uniref:L-2,4-diaminobutyric acid acetyltransferase n=1 Tax=Thiomicrospira cyclica (strain DSM 14477 / JCM 11371 / ALM1) TaxID=717773 RepID=F6DBZ4_THICA|nr:diaminobutyrate acetyltransferase [Thiomicrospira cyclica]AEG31380.1 L-2,4-diaminobutyric acid acetyltransferase [Thiomicrospira cyclica ALM1]
MFMNITIRPTQLSDGTGLANLVKASGTLDVNSDYLYFLLADHFSETCAIAVDDKQTPIGFVTAYRLPKDPTTLFIWQIAVAEEARGQGLAKKLLQHLTEQVWFDSINQVVCTISPHNCASNALFESFSDSLNAQLNSKDYLTTQHLGLSHDPEPYVIIELPT